MTLNAKIAYYAVDGSGLGHLGRVASLVSSVRSSLPTVQQLIVAGAWYGGLNGLTDASVMCLPAPVSSPPYNLDHAARRLQDADHYSILEAVLASYAPQLVVLDTYIPREIQHRIVAGRWPPCALLMQGCTRETFDRLTTSPAWPLLAAILVVHERSSCETTVAPIRAVAETDSRIEFVGEIARPLPSDAAKTCARAKLCLRDDERLIVCSCGSGGYPQAHTLLQRAIDVVQLLLADGLMDRAVIIKGPFYSWQPLRVEDRWREHVTVVDHDPNILALYANADLVISHAGYGTASELQALGRRVLFVPVDKATESQSARANAKCTEMVAAVVTLQDGTDEWLSQCVALLDREVANSLVPVGQGSLCAATRLLAIAGALQPCASCGVTGTRRVDVVVEGGRLIVRPAESEAMCLSCSCRIVIAEVVCRSGLLVSALDLVKRIVRERGAPARLCVTLQRCTGADLVLACTELRGESIVSLGVATDFVSAELWAAMRVCKDIDKAFFVDILPRLGDFPPLPK